MIKIAHSSVDNSSKTVDKSTFLKFHYPQRSGDIPLFGAEIFRFFLSSLHSSYIYYYYLISISLSFKQQQQNSKTKKRKHTAFYPLFERRNSAFPHNLISSDRQTCEQRGSAVFSLPALSRRALIGELKINPLIKSFRNNLPISGVYIKLSFLRAAVAWLSLLTNHAALAAAALANKKAGSCRSAQPQLERIFT